MLSERQYFPEPSADTENLPLFLIRLLMCGLGSRCITVGPGSYALPALLSFKPLLQVPLRHYWYNTEAWDVAFSGTMSLFCFLPEFTSVTRGASATSTCAPIAWSNTGSKCDCSYSRRRTKAGAFAALMISPKALSSASTQVGSHPAEQAGRNLFSGAVNENPLLGQFSSSGHMYSDRNLLCFG